MKGNAMQQWKSLQRLFVCKWAWPYERQRCTCNGGLYRAEFQPKVLGQTGRVRVSSDSRLFYGVKRNLIGWIGHIMVFRRGPM